MRFATAASLIAVGVLIGVGGVALLPSVAERPLIAIADDSSRPATPWMPGPGSGTSGPSNPVAVASAHGKTLEPVTEGVSTTSGRQVPGRQVPGRQASVGRQVSAEPKVSAGPKVAMARETARQ